MPLEPLCSLRRPNCRWSAVISAYSGVFHLNDSKPLSAVLGRSLDIVGCFLTLLGFFDPVKVSPLQYCFIAKASKMQWNVDTCFGDALQDLLSSGRLRWWRTRNAKPTAATQKCIS
jgi:hypothetical protein